MNLDATTVIGGIAAIMGMIMYLPQLYTVLTKKTTEGISKRSTLIYSFGLMIGAITSAGMQDTNYQGGMSNVIISALIIPLIMKLFFNHEYLERTRARGQYDGRFKTKAALYYVRRNRPIGYGAVIILTFIAVGVLTLIGVSKGREFTIGGPALMVLTIIAGLATSFGFVPQIILMHKTKSVAGVNPAFPIIYALMSALGTGYGLSRVITPSTADDNISEGIGMVLSAFGMIAQTAVLSLGFAYKNHPRGHHYEDKSTNDIHKMEQM